MDISSVFTSIAMMGIIVLFGVLIARRTVITNESKQLIITIIVNVAVPAIIFNGIFNTEIDNDLLGNILTIFIISVFVNAAGFLFGWFAGYIFKFKSIEAKKLGVLAGLGNSGFIGIPLCAQLFGPIGGLLAAIFDAGLDIVVFSFVIIVLQQGKGFSLRSFRALLNIPFFAIITGLTVAIIGFEPPIIISNLAAFLSSIAAPLAMIYIGLLIPEFFKEKRKIPFKFLSLSVTIKLLIFPLIMILLLQAIPLEDMIKKVAFVLLAMPTIMLAPILLARYTGDEATGVMSTVYSTIFSLLTIPFILYIANNFL